MAATNPARRPATYDDLRRVPDRFTAELIDGEIHASPRPAIPHTRTTGRLGGWLDATFDEGSGGPGGWIILIEPELHLGEDVIVPDLAGWRRERLPALSRRPWIDVAPDWVCEVVSPSTVSIDRGRKRDIYAREEIGWLWMIDPDPKILEVFWLGKANWVLDATHAGQTKIHARPFDAIELDLDRLWTDVAPAPLA